MCMLIMSLIMCGLSLTGFLLGQQPLHMVEAPKAAEWPKLIFSEVPRNEAQDNAPVKSVLEGKELATENVIVPTREPNKVVLTTKDDEAVKKQETNAITIAKEPIARVGEDATKQEAPKVQEPQNSGEMISIDTIDLDQPEGNWLNKRIWWERAKDKYKECRDVLRGNFSSRMIFLEKRAEIEKTILDPFIEVRLEQSEIRDILMNLIEDIEREREESGF